MSLNMLKEYEKDGLFDPIREIWKEKNIGQFFQEKTLQNERRFEEIEKDIFSEREKIKQKKLLEISGQT